MRAALALVLLASSLGAQSRVPRPDCNLKRHAIDQPWPHVNAVQPRWAWHTEDFTLANGIALTMRAFGANPFVSAGTANAITTDIPHVVGLLSHRYPFNAKDVLLADPVIHAAPLVWVPKKSRHPRLYHGAAIVGWLGLYLLVRCDASP